MPEHDTDDPGVALDVHIRAFFAGHTVSLERWPVGPIEQRIPGFRVYRVEPGRRFRAWTLITAGCWLAKERDGHGLEFVLSAPDADRRHVEIITMAAYYHAGPPSQSLDIGHTVPIGEAWTPDSLCDHLVVSLPYPYGRDLEICAWRSGHVRLLSVVPITATERAYKAANGLEALEQRIEDAGVAFTDPRRASVV